MNGSAVKGYKRVIKKKLGQILVENGIITREELEEAVKKQKEGGKLFGEVLVDLGYATEEEITAAVSVQYGVPCILLEHYEIDPAVIRLVPEHLARKHRCIPLDRMGDVLTVAIANPLDEAARDEIASEAGLTVRCFTATSANIIEAIGRHYGAAVPEHVELSAAIGEEDEKISTFEIKENGLIEEGR